MIGTRRTFAFKFTIAAILIFGAFLAFAPMLYMAGTAFKPNAYILETPPQFIPENPTLDNFHTALNSRKFFGATLHSVFVSVSATVLATLLTAMMAYPFARLQFFGKNFLFYTMLITMMVPGIILIIPQFIMASSLRLLNNLPALIVVYSAGGLAFNTFLLRGFFENLPRELEEAALIDGAGHFTIFWRIMLPLAAPAVATVAVFTFLGAWSEYILALNFLTDPTLRTLPVVIANFRGTRATDWGLIFAGSLVQVIPTVLIFVFFQRYFVQGLTSGGVRG